MNGTVDGTVGDDVWVAWEDMQSGYLGSTLHLIYKIRGSTFVLRRFSLLLNNSSAFDGPEV